MEENVLGEIFRLESRVHGSRGIPGDWRQEPEHGGGMVLDWGVHLLDQALLLFPGVALKTVYATLTNVTNQLVDDGFTVDLGFANGVHMLVEVGTNNFISLPRWYVLGSDGTAMIGDWGENLKIVRACGMDEEDVERIFGEFTRLSAAQGKEGFGLGLSITRKLVVLLGGTIEVSSEPGQGSTFSIRVPVEPSAGENEDEPAVPFAGLRALLLDDDNLQLAMFEGQLELLGVQVASCSHVEDAISYLRHESCDLFFTDIQMPEADGFELMRRLRAESDGRMRRVPVVAVSARSDMDMDMLRKHGFAAMLAKPFSQQELCSVLSSVTQRGEAAPPRPEVTEPVVQPADEVSGYHFDALTAFAAGDDAACRNILITCRGELQGQIAEMNAAFIAGDPERLSRVAHKWVPLFTMLGVEDKLPLLRKIEHPVGDEVPRPAAEKVIQEAEAIVAALQELLQEKKDER